MALATKGGVGTASTALNDGTVVAALVAVNAYGEVIDPDTGAIVAGSRNPQGTGYTPTLKLLKAGAQPNQAAFTNTTIGVVATNAALTKEEANRLARMADDGIARAIRPSHTMSDGDMLFALATGERQHRPSMTALGAVAAEVVTLAIVRAVLQASGLAGVPLGPGAGEMSGRIGFIGAGMTSASLARAFVQAALPVHAVASRTPASAKRMVRELPGVTASASPAEVVDSCDIVFLTVPDDAIQAVAESLAWRPGQLAVHSSGARSLDVLEPVFQGRSALRLLPPVPDLCQAEHHALRCHYWYGGDTGRA